MDEQSGESEEEEVLSDGIKWVAAGLQEPAKNILISPLITTIILYLHVVGHDVVLCEVSWLRFVTLFK